MMTPEEIKRTMDFILQSHANSAVRMDRLDENQKRHEENQKRHNENMARLEANQARHDDNLSRLEEGIAEEREQRRNQKEILDVLVSDTQDLLKVSANGIDRIKRLESRSDSVDEMIKVLRELLETTRRRPDNPKQDSN